MRAAAPGKLVLSGAYAVLYGAPAIVTAVDRYVVADTDRRADFLAPEVAAAIGDRPAPWFDASALRSGERKLGLGSSAAIVVASLAAIELAGCSSIEPLRLARNIFPKALAAHRKAQGGGSGIDVAASCYGGTLRCALEGDELNAAAHNLPEGLAMTAWAATQSSSTRGMVGAVRAFAVAAPARFEKVMGTLIEAAMRAAEADDRASFVDALRGQALTLAELGDCAGVPIVPASLRRIADEAIEDGVAVLPSGAGGGDIVLCVGEAAATATWERRLGAASLELVDLRFGAAGVHVVLA